MRSFKFQPVVLFALSTIAISAGGLGCASSAPRSDTDSAIADQAAVSDSPSSRPQQDAKNPGDGGGAPTASSTPKEGATLSEIRSNYFASKAPLPENKRILCPFLRLMESSRAFFKNPKEEDATKLADEMKTREKGLVQVSLNKLVETALGFGCVGGCDSVGALVASIQSKTIPNHPDKTVDLTQLHKAVGVAHDCGLTFSKGSTVVDGRRDETLKALEKLANDKEGKDKGHLSYADLYKVKTDTCNREKVVITEPEKVEVDLIYAYLGGPDRGWVDYSDVARFLRTELPETKLKGPLVQDVLAKIAKDHADIRVPNKF